MVNHLLQWFGAVISDAEEIIGPRKGPEKRSYAITKTLDLLKLEGIVTENPGVDFGELIKLIGNVIDAIVALLNFLGLLKKLNEKTQE